MEILIGDKNFSSWSMRPWLALKQTGAAFKETLIRLRGVSTYDDIVAAGSPSGLVPALKVGELVVWDTLAICEYLAERYPDAGLWPADPAARALARSAASEMHSGFAALRAACPMDLTLRTKASVSPETAANVRRIVRLWSELLTRFGGPFLAGEWSIADAFFTPVATRFRSYGLDLSAFGDEGAGAAYAARLLETPAFLEWEADALADEAAKAAT